MSEVETTDERPGIVTIERNDPRFAELVGTVPGLDEEASTALPTISDRQFFQALASEPFEIISEEEALDAVRTGAIPQIMQDVIDELPEDQRFGATMLLSGATTFERGNPMVGIFGASQSMDAEAIDAFWSFASTL